MEKIKLSRDYDAEREELRKLMNHWSNKRDEAQAKVTGFFNAIRKSQEDELAELRRL